MKKKLEEVGATRRSQVTPVRAVERAPRGHGACPQGAPAPRGRPGRALGLIRHPRRGGRYGRHDPVRAPGPQGLRQDPVHRRDPESHRDPAAVVRAVPPEGRSRPSAARSMGLQAVFKSVFPIADYNENAMLEFDSYHFGDPKYTVEECHDRGMTFAIPLKVTLRLVVFDHDKEAKTRTMREQRGAGGLSRRAAADDREGHLHHQRHRARGGQPAPALGRACSSTTTRARRWPRASRSSRPGSSPTAARGWSSSSTPTTSSTCASTAGGRCSATAFLRAFWFLEKGAESSRDEEILGQFYDLEEVPRLRGRHGVGEAAPPRRTTGAKVADDIKPPRHKEPIVQAGKTLNAKLIEKLVEAGVDKIPVRGGVAGGPADRQPGGGLGDRRGAGGGQRRAHLHRAGAGHAPAGGALQARW